MSQRKTVTCPNPDVLAQAVAVRVLTTIRNLLAEPGRSRVDIALTGGTDGNRVLRAIGTDPLADDLDASRVHIWWGDERFVPEDSDDRNAKQARRFLNILVERGLMPEENIHEMPADTRDAAQIAAATDEENDAVLADAAAAYQKELIEQLGEEPTLDIALFGVGPDAHFASLFPGRRPACAGRRRARFAEAAAAARDAHRSHDRPFAAHVGVRVRGAQGGCGRRRLRPAAQSAGPELLRRRRGTHLVHRPGRRQQAVRFVSAIG